MLNYSFRTLTLVSWLPLKISSLSWQIVFICLKKTRLSWLSNRQQVLELLMFRYWSISFKRKLKLPGSDLSFVLLEFNYLTKKVMTIFCPPLFRWLRWINVCTRISSPTETSLLLLLDFCEAFNNQKVSLLSCDRRTTFAPRCIFKLSKKKQNRGFNLSGEWLVSEFSSDSVFQCVMLLFKCQFDVVWFWKKSKTKNN